MPMKRTANSRLGVPHLCESPYSTQRLWKTECHFRLCLSAFPFPLPRLPGPQQIIMAVAFSQPSIPLDIIELIMEQLANDGDTMSTRALKASALACRAFLLICRKHIFSSIRLDGQEGDWSIHEFKRILERNPAVARYVRKLHYFNDFSSKRGPRILRHLRRVRELTIGSVDRMEYSPSRKDWKTFSPPFRQSLRYFIQYNDIVALSLVSISNLPMYILWSFPNLVDLELFNVAVAGETWPKKFKGSERPPELSILRVRHWSIRAMQDILCAVEGGASQVCDLSGLQDLYLETEDGRGGRSLDCINSILRSSRSLRTLELTIYPGLICLETLSQNLTEGSLKTLKKITIGPVIDGPSLDPYLHFTQVLEQISGRNSLEEIIFDIQIDTDRHCTVEPTTWEQIDTVLSGKGFPSLRRVLIQVTIAWYSPGHHEFHSGVESLGITAFSQLMENKEVDFDFVVKLEEV
ncbi:unnamed protein product [Cyclocybe aegerita]|uniref:Uncharacterized protein n=1 Tax=Cyclocybe aegerita TaxID=1973307 RepID=A0A8S0XZ10_CYCAE|nr:unnamed protein product [Cyclocybe aegerita]